MQSRRLAQINLRGAASNKMDIMRKGAKPKWWRDIEPNEASLVARTYVGAQNDALLAYAKIANEEPPGIDAEITEDLERQVLDQLTHAQNFRGHPNPPPLHVAVYVTRSFSVATLKDAVKALAWLELAGLYLSVENLPLTPLPATVENLPQGADFATLTEALLTTLAESLRQTSAPETPAESSGAVVLALDYWLRRFIGKGIEQYLTPTAMVVGTAPLLGHQNSFLSRKDTQALAADLFDRRSSFGQKYHARSWLELPAGVERPNTEAILKKMHSTLLKRKKSAASLLKTHLFLVDQARRKGGPDPLFTVHLADLLEAKGYERRADGDFHPETYREEWGRLVTLAGCWLEVRRVTEKNKRGKDETYIDETPYWHLEARRRLEAGDAIGLQQILIGDPAAPIVKSVLLRPGVWWALSDIGDKYLHIPREILALPTDGNGNAKERMAVQIAAVLALWVRSSQRQHAGTTRAYSVGSLLESAGIITHEEFLKLHHESARRIREHLAGENHLDVPTGAIHILARLGAFDVRVKDEADFWESGRGWKERFWDANLAVQIPNLGIAAVKN